MNYKQSFPALIDKNARILILGSLPGDLSISRSEYYAHPQNRFWKLLFELHDQEFNNDYQSRKLLLLSHGIALWDVCKSANRIGSMDTAIKESIPNDIHQLLLEYPNVKAIFFNGQAAQKLYDKHFERLEHILYKTLPSSSPANAQFNLSNLKSIWKDIL